MPKVKIQKSFSVSPDQLYTAVKEVLTTDKELKALEPSLKINEQSAKDPIKADVNGSRVEGFFEITSEGEKSSRIDINLKLPLILSPFKGLVQKKIEDKLNKIS